MSSHLKVELAKHNFGNVHVQMQWNYHEKNRHIQPYILRPEGHQFNLYIQDGIHRRKTKRERESIHGAIVVVELSAFGNVPDILSSALIQDS